MTIRVPMWRATSAPAPNSRFRPGPWKRAWIEAQKPKRFIVACAIGVILSGLFPSDVQSYRTGDVPGERSIANIADKYLRFANTMAQVALPLLMRDPVGMAQAVYVGAGTTLATHGLKRLVDKWEIAGTRLGERPSGGQPNVPSGHSSMASCAAYFVSRRYGLVHLIYLLPILLLAMYARVALDAHTVSAAIAGALLGLLMAALFTSRRSSGPFWQTRQAHHNTSAGPVVFDVAGALVQQYHGVNQTQAQTATRRAPAFIQAIEPLEDLAPMLDGNSRTVIGNDQVGHAVAWHEAHLHSTA